MCLLQLRAARGWNLEKTARVFLLDLHTLQSWLRVREDARVDGTIWLPAGTPVKGTIAEVHKVRRGGGSGGFEIVIPSVVIGDGEEIPLIGQG
jgi:hypothetical protein